MAGANRRLMRTRSWRSSAPPNPNPAEPEPNPIAKARKRRKRERRFYGNHTLRATGSLGITRHKPADRGGTVPFRAFYPFALSRWDLLSVDSTSTRPLAKSAKVVYIAVESYSSIDKLRRLKSVLVRVYILYQSENAVRRCGSWSESTERVHQQSRAGA